MTTDSFLLELFKEEHTHARHTETQRLEVTKFLLVGAGVLFGFMGTLKFSIYCLPFGVVIILLGLTGVAITSTYVDRFDDHRGRARALRMAIDCTVSPSGLAKKIYDENRIRKKPRVRDFWIRINYGVVIMGAICLVCNVLAVAARMQTDSCSHTFKERIMHQLFLN
jgi:hypothetical protein